MAQLLGIFGFLLVLLRAAILCFQSITIGGVLFFAFVTRRHELRRDELWAPGWTLIRWSACALGLAQLLFVVANTVMLTNSAEVPLREALGANYVFAGVLAILGAFTIAIWPTTAKSGRLNPVVFVAAALALAASVMTSHSASRMDNRALMVGLTTVHYLATASWIGGLPFLLLAMKRVTDPDAKAAITRNFSRQAQISVAALLLAGVSLSYVYVGSWAATYGTAYGIMVATKVILFCCLLVLGAANYFIVRGTAATNPAGANSLMRFAEAEIGIGLTVILAAAALTSQPPAADLTEDRVTLHEIAARFKPRMPRLSSPDVKELSESTKQQYKEAAAEGRNLPVAYVPGESPWNTDKPADRMWSEYNHNWAGLVVLALGFLALLSRSRYFPWAKIWPLAFLGLAVFLFLRADPENWPLGPNGFWESFESSDVLQHRAAVVLLIFFAAFQWGVETGRVKSHAAALVFPGVCALGGVVLLTHSHALTNVKEEMLAELSHTPLAICGIVAGWSRWLELRLPAENNYRKYLGWVWPVCFILVGLILLNYHEM
jgi:putative copper resistance protein D